LQVGRATAQLGVDHTTISKLLNGRVEISHVAPLRMEYLPRRDQVDTKYVRLTKQAAYDFLGDEKNSQSRKSLEA
jgi:plasmid maintenance system antidote protein VapI